jgi:hypothetical protein
MVRRAIKLIRIPSYMGRLNAKNQKNMTASITRRHIPNPCAVRTLDTDPSAADSRTYIKPCPILSIVIFSYFIDFLYLSAAL